MESKKSFLSLYAVRVKKVSILNWDGKTFVEVSFIHILNHFLFFFLLLLFDILKKKQIKEFATPDTVKSICCCDNLLFLGLKKDYQTINIQTGVTTTLFQTGKSGNAIVTKLSANQLILSRDEVGVFIGADGKPTHSYGIGWTDSAISVIGTTPYVIALLPKFVEIRTLLNSPDLVQVVPIAGAKSVAVDGNGVVFVATSTSIYKLFPVPIVEQLEELLSKRSFTEALSLCDLLPMDDPDRAKRTRAVNVAYSHSLFSQGQHKKAMEMFLDLAVDPISVIGVAKGILPPHAPTAEPLPPIEVVGDSAIKALIWYIREIRETPTPTPSALSTSLSASVPVANSTTTTPQSYDQCTEFHTIVDTSLLKCLAILGPSSAPSINELLQSPNSCHVEECAVALLNAGMAESLLLLYRFNGLHSQALELLTDPQFPLCDPKNVIEYLKSVSSSEFGLISAYFKRLLALPSSDRQRMALDALKIFTESKRDPPADPDTVLRLFKEVRNSRDREKEKESKEFDIKDAVPFPELRIPYLEYLVFLRGNTSPEHHAKLIRLYTKKIEAARRAFQKPGNYLSPQQEVGIVGETRLSLLKLLEFSKSYRPEAILGWFPTEDLLEERAILLSRVGQHDGALEIYLTKLKNYEVFNLIIFIFILSLLIIVG